MKKERKKQDKNIMSASATQGGHKNIPRGSPQRPLDALNYLEPCQLLQGCTKNRISKG